MGWLSVAGKRCGDILSEAVPDVVFEGSTVECFVIDAESFYRVFPVWLLPPKAVLIAISAC